MNLLQKLFFNFLPSKMKLIIKSNQLAEQGKYEEAIRPFEEEIGIEEVDRGNMIVFRAKLNQWIDQYGRNDETLMFLAQYASSLMLIRLSQASLTVLETALDLEASDYKDYRALASKLDTFWFTLDEATRFMLWMGLHGVLSIIGRTSEAMDVFKYDLGILHLSPDDITYKEEIETRIEKKLYTLQSDLMATYLTFIFPLFEKIKLEKQGLILFEKLLGLTEYDYQQSALLSKKLNKWINGLQNPLTGKFALLGLASSLYQANEEIKALALLEAYPDIQVVDYENVEHLSQKWKALRDSLPVDAAATYYRIFISMLETTQRNPQQIKALVQADTDLRDVDFEVADSEAYSRMGEKLHRRIANFQEDTKGAYIFSLGEIMYKIGMYREAAFVTEWFMDQHNNFHNIPKEGDPAIIHVVAILSNWFRFFHQNSDPKVLDYCRLTMRYLRTGFDSQGVRFEDRKEFIQYVGLLKTAILNTGFFHLGLQASQDMVSALALEVLLWDIELSQRVLAERFILEEHSLLPPDPTTSSDQWAFLEPIPPLYPNISVGLEMGHSSLAPLTNEENSLVWMDNKTSTTPTEESNLYIKEDTQTKVLRQIISEEVNANTVAQSVGANAMILRISFLDDGRLAWLAFLSDGQHLEFIGKHVGYENDREIIQLCVTEHESGIKEYWRDVKSKGGRADDFLTIHTKTYIESLSSLLCLDLIAPFLDDSIHLVIQADGLLNAVPFPYISVQGKPIFLQVASVSQAISLLFQVLQQNTRSLTQNVDLEKKLVVGSWFKKQEHESFTRAAARQLHAAHWALAREHELTCFMLGDQPMCSIEAVAGLVQQHSNIALLTLLGHGNANFSGIQLQNNELWKGDGCDLSGIELVLMVSCSIGRMHKGGNYLDVEGFCIQLAVSKAFSIIACRWEIDAWEACLFANEIARQYLAVSCAVPTKDQLPPFSKVKALNEARKIFYHKVGDNALNTLAAFEFYGLG